MECMRNMAKKKCSFCKKHYPIKYIDNNNHYLFSFSFYSNILELTDKKRDREYYYFIKYCPICGKKCF